MAKIFVGTVQAKEVISPAGFPDQLVDHAPAGLVNHEAVFSRQTPFPRTSTIVKHRILIPWSRGGFSQEADFYAEFNPKVVGESLAEHFIQGGDEESWTMPAFRHRLDYILNRRVSNLGRK